ncbi:MAG: glycosyltransferase [Bacilli bacterium]|nr:glycosyltransferase [Bacilli bacterium]
MKKVNILLIGFSDNLGGIETYLINLYRLINKDKFNVKFLVFKDTKYIFYDEIKKDLIYITSRKKNFYNFIKDLKNLYLLYDFDIIHCNLMSFSFFEPIIYGLKYSKATLILHSHVAGKIKNPFKTSIISNYGKLKILNNKYKGRYVFFGCSQDAIDDLFGSYYRDNNCDYYVVNNGIEIDKFLYSSLKREKIRNELKLSKNDFLIGHVGRFTYAKNHKKIISIFNLLLKENDNFKLLLIGDGELKKEINLQILKYGIADKVIILSNINNVYDYMSAMDLFLFPSIFEGFGIAVVEAQVSGLKCLISNCIPKEIEISSKIVRCDNSSDDNTWIREIIKVKNSNRNSRTINKTVFKKFESSISVSIIEDIYKKIKFRN